MKQIFRVLYSKELKCYGVRMRTKTESDLEYIFQCGDIWTVKDGKINSLVSVYMPNIMVYNPLKLDSTPF